jgi:hypothetical protein
MGMSLEEIMLNDWYWMLTCLIFSVFNYLNYLQCFFFFLLSCSHEPILD